MSEVSETHDATPTRPRRLSAVEQWDIETDIAIVGFGGAGACAAIEAAAVGVRRPLEVRRAEARERRLGPGRARGLEQAHEPRLVRAPADVLRRDGRDEPLQPVQRAVPHGRVRRAWLGIGVTEVLLPAPLARRLGLGSPRGVAIRSVDPGSPAHTGGLVPGDVLVRLRGARVESVADVHRRLDADAIGTAVSAEYLRDGRVEETRIRARESPAPTA